MRTAGRSPRLISSLTHRAQHFIRSAVSATVRVVRSRGVAAALVVGVAAGSIWFVNLLMPGKTLFVWQSGRKDGLDDGCCNDFSLAAAVSRAGPRGRGVLDDGVDFRA